MKTQAKLLNTLLQQLMAAFPRAFGKGAAVRPLKIGIGADLLAALPPGLGVPKAMRFLGWYVNRPAYLKALARGESRIDLTGAVVDTEIPEDVRNHAKQRLESWQKAPAGKPGRSRQDLSRPQPPH